MMIMMMISYHYQILSSIIMAIMAIVRYNYYQGQQWPIIRIWADITMFFFNWNRMNVNCQYFIVNTSLPILHCQYFIVNTSLPIIKLIRFFWTSVQYSALSDLNLLYASLCMQYWRNMSSRLSRKSGKDVSPVKKSGHLTKKLTIFKQKRKNTKIFGIWTLNLWYMDQY